MTSLPRYDWYQTESDVCISILVKNRKQVSIEYSSNKVKIGITTLSEEEHDLSLCLEHDIDPQHCRHKELQSKIEIKVRKKLPIQWAKLGHLQNSIEATEVPDKQKKDTVHTYPTSHSHSTNWNKLMSDFEKEEEAEKPEGDAALNKLFQQIYSGGNEEVKKAMNKSFVESGGTVLSTNWKEVGEKEVEMKPPDGMEWKKYQN